MTSTTTTLAGILSGEPLPIPPPVDDPEIDKFNRDVINYLRRLAARFTSENIVSDSDLRIDDLNGHIVNPIVKDYTLVEYAEFKFKPIRLTHKLASGGCTVNIEVNGTALGGTGDQTPSSSQGVFTFNDTTVTVGQRVELAVSALSSPVDLGFTLKRERIL